MTNNESVDFSDPAQTIQMLDELVDAFGMTLDQFRRLHHLPESGNLTIGGHRSYARTILRGATRRFSGDDKNVGTARRLAACLEGLRAGQSWDNAITLAASGSAVGSAIGAERQAIRDMLFRIPIERAQRAFYKWLLESPASSFRQSEMEEKLEFTSRSFQSALNALSKRVNDTPDLTLSRPGHRFVFDIADEEDDRVFSGKPALMDELRANPDLMAALSRDWPTILDDEAFVRSGLGPRVGQVAAIESVREVEDSRSSERLPLAQGGEVEFDPVAYELVQRRLRRHQSAFRAGLLRAYEGRCAISGTNVLAVLEAAHIEPHVERGDNSSENGLLLRSDLHALFDEGLLRIHPTTLEVHLDSTILDSSYALFNGQKLRPRADGVRVSVGALEARWHAAKWS